MYCMVVDISIQEAQFAVGGVRLVQLREESFSESETWINEMYKKKIEDSGGGNGVTGGFGEASG